MPRNLEISSFRLLFYKQLYDIIYIYTKKGVDKSNDVCDNLDRQTDRQTDGNTVFLAISNNKTNKRYLSGIKPW